MGKIVNKTLTLLSVFTRERPRMTFDEIVSISGIPSSTIYRFLNTLLKLDFLSKDDSEKTYRLGPAFLRLSRIAEAGLDFHSLAKRWMDKLWKKTGETVYLSTRIGSCWLCLESQERRGGGLKFSVLPGETGPLYAGAAGKVFLAHLGDSELERFLKNNPLAKVTSKTITDPKKLMRQLSEIRNRGYSYTKGENIPGAWGIGAPIFNAHGSVEAVLSLVGILDLKQKPPVTEYAALLNTATSEISGKLGYLPMKDRAK
jgi:IclR family KDG regulon transcriptional repressor